MFGAAGTAGAASAAGAAAFAIVGGAVFGCITFRFFSGLGVGVVSVGFVFAAGTAIAAGRAGFAAVFAVSGGFLLTAGLMVFVRRAASAAVAAGRARRTASGLAVIGMFILNGWTGCVSDSRQSENEHNDCEFDLRHFNSPDFDKGIFVQPAVAGCVEKACGHTSALNQENAAVQVSVLLVAGLNAVGKASGVFGRCCSLQKQRGVRGCCLLRMELCRTGNFGQRRA